MIEAPGDLTTLAPAAIALGWYGGVYEDRAAYDRDPTTQLTDDEVLAELESAARVVMWPDGDPVRGRFEVIEPGDDIGGEPASPRLSWRPDEETHGWQALVIDYVSLPPSFHTRGAPPDASRIRRFNHDSAPVVIGALVRSVTPDDADIIAGGVNTYPDGHMVTISFSEPLANAADLYEHIAVTDWPGCVPYRYVPTPETVQTVSFQCPRRDDAETSDRTLVQAEVGGRVTSSVGATVQSAYGLATPDDVVVIEMPPDPSDTTMWAAPPSELARAAGLQAP